MTYNVICKIGDIVKHAVIKPKKAGELLVKAAWTEEKETVLSEGMSDSNHDSEDFTTIEYIDHPAKYNAQDETSEECLARLAAMPNGLPFDPEITPHFIYQGDLPDRFEADFDKQTVTALVPLLTSDHVNAETLENLKKIWGGETETKVAQYHQNAVGIMGRLVNKIVAEEAVLSADEEAIKDAIKAQLEAHEAVLTEGRRIKALSPIPANFKELLAAVLR